MTDRGVPLSAWMLLAVSWLTFLLAYVGRQCIFSIFPVLQSQLGFSNAQLGLTGSIFLWVYSLGSPLGGVVGDRFHFARVAQWSVVVWSLVTVVTGFATSPEWVLASRALLGATQCIFVPAALAAIASVHPGTTRSKAVAIWGTAQLAGIVVGGWYGGFVAEQLDWRWVFWLVGGIGVVYGLGLRRVISRLLPAQKAEERRLAGNDHSSVSANPLNLFGIATFALCSISFFILCAMLWVIYAWLPTFFVEKFALSLSQAGLSATLSVQVTTALGLLMGGFAADRMIVQTKAARIWLLIVGMVGAAPCLHFLATASSPGTTRLAAACFGLFSGLYVSNAMASVLDVVQARRHASAVGVMNMVGGVSGGLAAYLIGQLKTQYGIERMMSLVGASGALSLVVLLIAVVRFFPSDYRRVQQAGG
ncbi:MAG: MFS transporter [Acidobacteria bacterium]|nr:MFS transporter [Acidobacteriota bacterium]MCI0721761.1 MFS transporter [Acidobacteriota bacterium]